MCKPELVALALVLACSQRVVAQDEGLLFASDERRDAIGMLRLGIARPALELGISPAAASAADGGGSIGLALAALEKKGAVWEAVRLDGLRYWADSGLQLSATLLDLGAWMWGANADGGFCAGSLAVMGQGDCVSGGVFGVHAQLLHGEYQRAARHGFMRWFELGAVINPVGDSFDTGFSQGRMPITLAVSLDHHLAGAADTRVALRGAVGIDGVARSADRRFELTGWLRYRPALAPFDAEDWAVEARARVALLWLAALGQVVRPIAQRVFLELRYTHWEQPDLAPRALGGARDLFELSLGFELTWSNLTPN